MKLNGYQLVEQVVSELSKDFLRKSSKKAWQDFNKTGSVKKLKQSSKFGMAANKMKD